MPSPLTAPGRPRSGLGKGLGRFGHLPSVSRFAKGDELVRVLGSVRRRVATVAKQQATPTAQAPTNTTIAEDATPCVSLTEKSTRPAEGS